MPSSLAKRPLALAIGIVGHRPNRLPEETSAEVEGRIDEILRLLQRTADEAGPGRPEGGGTRASLTLISALAEGADRMAARSALRNGLALEVVLPFSVDDYERDFVDPASRAEYRWLIDAAERVDVLPGDYDTERRDYDPVGRMILDTADIILGVWDGGPSAGRGGTTDLLQRAAARGIPVIHVDAADREPPRLLWSALADRSAKGADLADIPSAPLAEVIGTVIDGIAAWSAEPARKGPR